MAKAPSAIMTIQEKKAAAAAAKMEAKAQKAFFGELEAAHKAAEKVLKEAKRVLVDTAKLAQKEAAAKIKHASTSVALAQKIVDGTAKAVAKAKAAPKAPRGGSVTVGAPAQMQ